MLLAQKDLEEVYSYLTLMLMETDEDKVYPIGLGEPDSYRGDYEAIAFTPEKNITLKKMIENVEGVFGKTYVGYKGGEYTMSKETACYVANYGECGTPITEFVLDLMFGKYEYKY